MFFLLFTRVGTCSLLVCSVIFFFNDTSPPEIYTYRHTLSLHDALPICPLRPRAPAPPWQPDRRSRGWRRPGTRGRPRSEEHTSELQSLMRISYAVFCLTKNISVPKHATIIPIALDGLPPTATKQHKTLKPYRAILYHLHTSQSGS